MEGKDIERKLRKKEIFFGKTDRKVFKSIGIVEAVGSERYNNKTYFEIVFKIKKRFGLSFYSFQSLYLIERDKYFELLIMRKGDFVYNDFLLIRKMKQGDDNAFDLFVHKYYQEILSYCYHHCFDQTYAEDFTQETFIRFFSKLPDYHYKGKTLNYLYTIAGNLCKDYLKKTKETLLEEIATLKTPLTEVQEDLKKLRDIRYWVRKATPGTEESKEPPKKQPIKEVLQDKADEKKAQRTAPAQAKHRQQDMEL